MEIISIEGFVVSSLKYGENSKILNILTKEKGIIGVIAKGALNEKSKLRVISNLFTYAVFHLYYKENKLCTLISADVKNYFINIRSDIEKMGYMSYLTELTRNVYKQASENAVYDTFISALLKIEEGFNPKVITNIVEIKFLDFLGISLNLSGCVECGSTSIVSISHSRGGYVCALHRRGEPSYDEAVLKMIKAYYYVDIDKISELNLKSSVINAIDSFLNVYYKEYTGLYLKSKNFIDNLENKC